MLNQSVSAVLMKFSGMFPGIKFSPTDEELISHYLKRKLSGFHTNDDAVICEVHISKLEPWDLPAKSVIKSNDEWIFFSPVDKKYRHGPKAKRATEAGFWKATGKERDVISGKTVIGTKRSLVFHKGRSPQGTRTHWIMYEYHIKENGDDRSEETYAICRIRNNEDFSRKDPDPNVESTSRTISSPSSSDPCAFSSNVFDDLQHLQQLKGAQLLQTSTDADMECQDDDCFADIMNDDIVQLDESMLLGSWQLQNVTDSLPERLPLSNVSEDPCERLVLPEAVENEAAAESTQLASPFMPTADHSQGTANRRIRLARARNKKNPLKFPDLYLEDVAEKVEKVTDGDGAAKSSSVVLASCLLCVIFVAVMYLRLS